MAGMTESGGQRYLVGPYDRTGGFDWDGIGGCARGGETRLRERRRGERKERRVRPLFS